MLDKAACYALLEQKFLSYADLRPVAVTENGDPMVAVPAALCPAAAEDGTTQSMNDLVLLQQSHTGKALYVRAALLPMLAAAEREVAAIFPGCRLEVVFGYRHPEVQEAAYARVRAEVIAAKPDLSPEDLDEAIHRFVAVPDVAGHPTGGAVDVHIRGADGAALDMGTAVGAFVEDSYVYSPFIGKAAFHHRQILRTCMIRAGFAPFDGEWWHFSYGDREWAKYYGRPGALYTQLRFSV